MDSILALRQRDAPFRAPRQPHSIQSLFAQDTDVEASPVLSTKNWIAPIFDPSLSPFAAKQVGRSKQGSPSAGEQQPYQVPSRHSRPLNHHFHPLSVDKLMNHSAIEFNCVVQDSNLRALVSSLHRKFFAS